MEPKFRPAERRFPSSTQEHLAGTAEASVGRGKGSAGPPQAPPVACFLLIFVLMTHAPFRTFALPPTGCRVRIQYIDASYRRTERVIEPLRTYRSRYGETYLEAFCHLRGEKRTFRLDRIACWVVEEVQERFPARPAAAPAAPGPAPSERAAPRLTASPVPFAVAVSATVRPTAAQRAASVQTHRGRSIWGWILSAVVAVAISRALFPAHDPSAPRPRPYVAYPAPVRTEAVQPPGPKTAVAARTSPGPAPARTVRGLTYRGMAITATPVGDEAWRYTAGELGLETRTRRGMHLAVNSVLFRQATGISDADLEKRYAAADTDRDGYLSWAELEAFQRALHREFRYLSNATALRPDEFQAQGGGDCEDWALMSCGLLRYWGWTAYVGSFVAPSGGEAHAVCLVRGEHRSSLYHRR